MAKALQREAASFFSITCAAISFVTLFASTFFLNAFEASFSILWMYPCGLTTTAFALLDEGGGFIVSLIAIQTFIFIVLRVLGLFTGGGLAWLLVGFTALVAAIGSAVGWCKSLFS